MKENPVKTVKPSDIRHGITALILLAFAFIFIPAGMSTYNAVSYNQLLSSQIQEQSLQAKNSVPGLYAKVSVEGGAAYQSSEFFQSQEWLDIKQNTVKETQQEIRNSVNNAILSSKTSYSFFQNMIAGYFISEPYLSPAYEEQKSMVQEMSLALIYKNICQPKQELSEEKIETQNLSLLGLSFGERAKPFYPIIKGLAFKNCSVV